MKTLLLALCFACVFSVSAQNDRKLWLGYLDKVARPVMQNLAADEPICLLNCRSGSTTAYPDPK